MSHRKGGAFSMQQNINVTTTPAIINALPKQPDMLPIHPCQGSTERRYFDW